MIYIKLIPVSKTKKPVDEMTNEEKRTMTKGRRAVAQGETHEEALTSLVGAVNREEVDDINNYLVVIEDNH